MFRHLLSLDNSIRVAINRLALKLRGPSLPLVQEIPELVSRGERSIGSGGAPAGGCIRGQLLHTMPLGQDGFQRPSSLAPTTGTGTGGIDLSGLHHPIGDYDN